jgi:hypothetical protein
MDTFVSFFKVIFGLFVFVLVGMVVSQTYSFMVYDAVPYESRLTPGQYRVVEKRCIRGSMFTIKQNGEVTEDYTSTYQRVSC